MTPLTPGGGFSPPPPPPKQASLVKASDRPTSGATNLAASSAATTRSARRPWAPPVLRQLPLSAAATNYNTPNAHDGAHHKTDNDPG